MRSRLSSPCGAASRKGRGSGIARGLGMDVVPAIRVVGLRKNFGPLEVLKGVSFDVHKGNVVSMIGASGSDKSTLLRCINFLETPSGGDVFIDGQPMGFRTDVG